MTTVNAVGVKLVKDYEGFKAKAYLCPAGVWTIGWGRTEGVKEGDTTTMAKEHVIFTALLNDFARDVEKKCKIAPNDNELAAMTSLAYNIGIGGFGKSTVLKCHNRGESMAAARAFALWNKANGKVLPGLVRRRAAEAALYLEPVGGDDSLMPQKIDEERPMSASVQLNAGSAAALTSIMGVGAQIAQSFKQIEEGFGAYLPYIAGGLACAAAIAGIVVAVERIRQRRRGEA